MPVVVRTAVAADAPAIAALDHDTWAPDNSPGPRPSRDADPLAVDAPGRVVLVAELDGRVAGFAALQHPTRLPSGAHVLLINGLAVDPGARRRGVGLALLDGLAAYARSRDVRKLSLRVLSPNRGARALYARAGFDVEGVLRGQFVIDGRDVDDVLMARWL